MEALSSPPATKSRLYTKDRRVVAVRHAGSWSEEVRAPSNANHAPSAATVSAANIRHGVTKVERLQVRRACVMHRQQRREALAR